MAYIQEIRGTRSALRSNFSGLTAPVTVNESYNLIYQAGSNFTIPINKSSQWIIEAYGASEEGAEAYATASGVGYEFQFKGTSFILRGLANSNGGTFNVYVNDAKIGVGTCYEAGVTTKIHFSSPVMPLSIYTVRTEKIDGAALYCDTIVIN